MRSQLEKLRESTAESKRGKITAWWSEDNDHHNLEAFYSEFKVTLPEGSARDYYIAFDQWSGSFGYAGSGYPQPSARIRVSRPASKSLGFYGFFDSPYLDPNLYGGDPNNILPKGLELKAHVNVTDVYGKTTKAPVIYEQHGSDCWEYTDGEVDFSGDDLKTVWANLGQNSKRQFWIDPKYVDDIGTSRVNIAFDFYEDPAFTTPASFTFDADRSQWDRMRPAYAKATRINPSSGASETVPVKLMYYLDPGCWPHAGQVVTEQCGRADYKLRIRPYVLKEEDPSLPLNPVGVTPYRSLIKWMSFTDAELRDAMDSGTPLSRDVIPGFITAQCKVREYQAEETDAYTPGGWKPSTLDAWAPGYYYEDGGPWMIGDDQEIAIHQTGDGNRSTITLDCWGERQDIASTEGSSSDAKVFRFPIGAFVAIDAESTDGGRDSQAVPYEFLAMATQDASGNRSAATLNAASGAPFPITGFSMCTTDSINALVHNGVLADASSLRTAPGTTLSGRAGFTDTSPMGTRFFNPDGRCGELNESRQWGTLFGPTLMVVAPTAFESGDAELDSGDLELSTGNTQADIDAVKKRVTVAMKGKGKEALGFGVIIGGDTSNADYNTFMPPAYQISSLSFNEGKSDANGVVDWTLPRNYNQNYFYYGARLGRRAVPYSPYAGALKVKDGARNDALPADFAGRRLGNDTDLRTQPKIRPVADSDANGTTRAYTSDKPGTWLAGADTQTLSVTASGGHLTPAAHKPLTVTILCGQSYSMDGSNLEEGTVVRGWADFNGNGAFDPEEASTVGTCRATTIPPRAAADMNNPTNDMPWTGTTEVTVTFDYPAKHAVRGKRDVWMRLRAVDGEHRSFLDGTEANRRLAATAYAGSKPRQVNPDADAPTGQKATSAYGAWRFTPSGETEDYLFDITTPVKGANDLICVPSGQESYTFDVLPNDDEAIKQADKKEGISVRRTNPDSLVFLDRQAPGVTVSDQGLRATVANEGTYTIDRAYHQVTFTPTSSMRKRMEDGNVTLTSLSYAFTTAEGTYDRSVAGSARIQGSAGIECGKSPLITTTMSLREEISYQWSLDKTCSPVTTSPGPVLLASGLKRTPVTGRLARPLTSWV